MVVFAIMLIVFGVFVALMGLKIFRVALPFLGFVSGIMVGFSGTQAIFGKGVVSLAIALTVSFVLGVLLAVLSFLFYDLAVVVLMATVGAALFSYLGLALGLEEGGFVLFLLSLAGGIIGAVTAAATGLSVSLIISLTALAGVGYVFAGILLLVGELSLDSLHNTGIIQAVIDTVDQSFLWVFAWIGASLVAIGVQQVTLEQEVFGGTLEYKD